MTSPDAFFIFWKFWFSGLLGRECKRAKNGPKWQIILSHSLSQELYLIWLWFLVHMCKMMISPAIFFRFFKILIFRFFQTSSVNAKRKFWGMPHLRHMCVIFFLYLYPTLSEISYAISYCLPTGKIATFAPTKFHSKCFIFL